VGVVEQAEVAVLEASGEELQAHIAMRNVGHRGDNDTAGLEQAPGRHQHPARVAKVLEHIAAQHRLKAPVAKLGLEIERVKITNDHFLRPLAGLLGGLGADPRRR
jgi:phage protein D